MSLIIDLNNRTALVTGVTSGVGAGVAQVLAAAGANVIGCGRSAVNSEGAKAFQKSIAAAGGESSYFPVDVSTEAGPAQLVTHAVEVFGGLDIVISNAGLNVFRGVDACSEEDWQRNMNLNLASHWRLGKAARPYLAQRPGSVFQVMTSNHAFGTISGCFPYNVTKTALLGLVRAMAVEWGVDTRVVGVAPGFIETPGNDAWFDSFEDSELERQRTIALHPVGRLGTPEDVGNLCAFLASPLARFASGETYLLDGGRSALMQDPT